MKLKNLLFTFAIALVFAACSKKLDPKRTTETPYVADNSFKIVSYMPGYRDPALISDQKYKMITHLFFAFVNVNPSADGSLVPLTTTTNSRMVTLRTKAKANNVKFGVSVMGAETIFATMASNPTSRTNFVNNIVAFAKANELDGIDIDWEYPRTVNGQPSTDFTLMMQQLSVELHKANKYLSAAITPAVYPSTNKDAIEQAVYQYVDFFNIMQYDGGIGYDPADNLNHATYRMSVNSLNVWIDQKKMPREKAIMGIPLYGKAGSSSVSFSAIEASGADLNLNVARIGGVDYGYNGIPLVKQKAQLAKDRANGIMFWEFSHDTNSANSLIKAANDQLGRTY